MTQPSVGICRLWNSFCNLGPDCTMVGSHSFCFRNCLWAQLGENKDAPIFLFLDKSVGWSRRNFLILRFMDVGGKIDHLLFWGFDDRVVQLLTLCSLSELTIVWIGNSRIFHSKGFTNFLVNVSQISWKILQDIILKLQV